MSLNIESEVADLNEMTVTQLRQRYGEVFGEATRSGNKTWLIKRIAWRLQANAEGDLSDRARQHALSIANDADLRMKAPKSMPSPVQTSTTRQVRAKLQQDNRVPIAGSMFERQYKGKTYRVTVLESGFEYNGETFTSLSAVAKAITGSHWNGYLFFGFKKQRGAQ